MAETRPIIDSLDSSDEEVAPSTIKRKDPPIEQQDEPSKKRKSQSEQPGDRFAFHSFNFPLSH